MNILKEIKSGNISGIYLFYGEEKYKKKVYKDALRANVPFGNEMNYSYFEGKDIDLQAVYDSVVTLPFFSGKRLVIIENCDLFKNKKKKNSNDLQAENESSVNDTQIEKIIDDRPETTCLVFLEDDVSKAKKIYKKIASEGVVLECGFDSKDVIIKWVKKGFSSYGKNIDDKNANFLVERVGADYTTLLHEIEKLVAYKGDDVDISFDDINDVCIKTIESKIFDIMDSMSDKKCQDVLDKYKDMILNREEPLYILSMIRRQFRIMLQVAEEIEKGCGDMQISKTTGYKTFIIKKMRSYLQKNYSKYDIIKILDFINNIDCQAKSGDISAQFGVELLLIQASS